MKIHRIYQYLDKFKTKSQNFLDPRFSINLVLVKPGFQKYRPRFKKTIEHITQTTDLILQTYPKHRNLINLGFDFFCVSYSVNKMYKLNFSRMHLNNALKSRKKRVIIYCVYMFI